MKSKSFLAVLALLVSGLLIYSCNKQKSYNTSFSEDYAYAENVFGDISNISDEGYEKGSSGLKTGDGAGVILSECADVTLNLSTEPYSLVVDFGEENCLCNDDRYRRGKIIVSFDGLYREAGTTITHTTEDYYVDDNQVDGTKTVMNKGKNENGNIYFEISETGTIVKHNDEGIITWNSEREREWVEGSETLNIRDDIYLIGGKASGTTTTNESWQMKVINPLRVELDCRWIPYGSITIDIEGIPTALLDYGLGDCDRNATVEIDGKVYNIVLK